jgi:hypothetical protein
MGIREGKYDGRSKAKTLKGKKEQAQSASEAVCHFDLELSPV